MSEAALLEVESLSVSYGAVAAVDGVSFTLGSGRCLGIIGESGAGKSQGFLALLGLLSQRARVTGAARLAGEPLLPSGHRKARGREIAMIFQDPMTALTPHLRIGDQVAEPLVTHRRMSWHDARRRAAELLDQVQMSDVPRRMLQYPHELSGGMRQRAMIAMALACDPKLLVADEPTTALDVSVQAQLLRLLRKLVVERQMALALITHDMGVIATLADDVVVMRSGRIVERGAIGDILATPRHEYTRSLLAATPRMDSPVKLMPPRDGKVSLVVRSLDVRYPLYDGWLRRPREFLAVSDVSLEVGAGEALGIVGESGSGKSSLARALLRLGPVYAGEIVWLGQPLQQLAGESLRALRADLQVVFQDPLASLDPTMTVEECIAEPLRALRTELDAAQRRVRVLGMLEQVGLGPEFADRRSRTLSGGQCQRVAIARAMILGPKLLVCDEAVSSLDVSIQAQILELLADIKRSRGTSLVFVSHNLAVVRQLCERVAVMYLGKVVETGPTGELFSSPRHPYTRMLLDSVPALDRLAGRAHLGQREARGEMPSAVDRPAGCVFHQRCPHARELCATQSPVTEDAGNSRQVACIRWRELEN
jgi:oligopeptide/dipeptide ABC transporter ATP-binding protein